MASSVEAIKHKINHVLYSRKSAITSRTFQNHLVEKGILSDEQLEQHHKLIDELFWEWRTGFYAQHSEHHQRLPMSPQTPKSLPPQAAPRHKFISSPPEDTQTATDVEMLKEAVASINSSVSQNSPPLPVMNDQLLLTCRAVATARRCHDKSFSPWRHKSSLSTRD